MNHTSAEGSEPGDVRPLLFALVQNPTGDAYLALWRRVTSAPTYDPYGNEVRQVQDLCEAGQYQEGLDAARSAFQSCLLSPRLHLYAGLAANHLGDQQTSDMERMIAHACLQGILGTGDGSAERPYLVASTDDEYDVLFHLQKQLRLQALLKQGDKTLDRLDCTDGTTLHFDVTTPYARLNRTLDLTAGDE